MSEQTHDEQQTVTGSRVSVWGSRKSPSWSVVVAENTTDEELGRIVRRAIEAWREVGRELAGETPDPLHEEPLF